MFLIYLYNSLIVYVFITIPEFGKTLGQSKIEEVPIKNNRK